MVLFRGVRGRSHFGLVTASYSWRGLVAVPLVLDLRRYNALTACAG